MAAEKYGLDRRIVLDLGEGAELAAVLIPPGTFMMGGPAEGAPDANPPHEVTISRPFYMGVTEVTNRQLDRFLAETGHGGDDEFELRDADGVRFYDQPPPIEAGKWPDPDQPAVQVTWHTAEAFCAWLSARSGRRVSLPTEARWEYACRAGAGGDYYFGPLLFRPWYEWTRAAAEPPLPGGGHRSIAPTKVGFLRRPNPWGLYDMLGNVREYCSDWFAPLPASPQLDPAGPDKPPALGRPSRVLRGGSADEPVTPCYRRGYQLKPGYDRTTGFRVCIEAAPPAAAPQPAAPDPVYPKTTPPPDTVPQ
jgi:formylglycine-generating enzyme required for sulfatase activity